MAQPAWQSFMARELAARANGASGAHMAAALVVRDLLARNTGLATAMQAVPQATQEDYFGADKPDVFVKALRKMWDKVGVRETKTGEAVSDPQQVAAAFWTLARVAYLSLPPEEIKAAQEVAAASRKLPRFGAEVVKTAAGEEERWAETGWDTGEEWWGLNSLSGGGFNGGFSALRDELLAAATTEEHRLQIQQGYDRIAGSTAIRKSFVEDWQRQMKAAGLYTARVDGLWGPASETAFTRALPRAYGRGTSLADLQALLGRYGGNMAMLIAVGISRDRWVAANPNRLPSRPTTEETRVAEEAAREETIVLEPSDGAEAGERVGEVQRVEITLPPEASGTGETETVIVRAVEEEPAPAAKRVVWPWVLGAFGLAGLLAMTWSPETSKG